ncbi:MAG: nuclear transport factor 2 family protein, partial [Rubrobacter sp.]|nr:nuclear transport factor 2 family protein [Rubrobacter sp.]
MEDTFQLQARRFVEQVNREMYELGNLDVVEAVYGDGYTVHDPAGSGEGAWRTSEEIKKGILDMRLAFPDMRIDVGELMAYLEGRVTM